MNYYRLLDLFLFVSLASAQFPSVNKSLICPASTLDHANASGSATFLAWELQSYFNKNPGNTNLSMALTVDEGSQTGYNNISFPTLDTSLWIGQPPSIDLYDGSNGFSGCAFAFGSLPINTIERGQDDDGSCHQTFSEACVTALTNQVAEYAQWQVNAPTGGPYSNLTPPILGYVCGNIQAAIGEYSGNGPVQNAFPAECQPYFDDGSDGQPAVDILEITSNTTNEFNGSCWVQNSTSILPGYLLRQATTSFVNCTGDPVTDTAAYDNATCTVLPVLSVFMPQANNSRQETISTTWAQMTCLRTSRFSKASRVSPILAAPTPVHIPHLLRSGAKAGFAVGVILAVALVVAAAGVWYFLRRRKAAAAALEMDKINNNKEGEEEKSDDETAQLAGNEKYEVPGDGR